MAESNSIPQDSSQPSPKDNSRDENLLSDIKDVDAPRAQPSIDRFEIIRKSTSKSTICSSLPHILRKIKTYRTNITIQSYMKNARRPPPPYIVDDHLQADIDEPTKALGRGVSIIIDRALVYISEEGDIAFLLGPNPFSRFSSTATDNPTQYIFSLGKSSKDVDALGAWSPLAVELPNVERHEAICEKLGDSAKNWEYPIACTPIIFKGFSERAKRRILEASLEPQKRTLGAIDVSLEDGVTLFTEVERAEEKEEGDVRDVADESTLPAQSTQQGPEKEAHCEGETQGVVPALYSVMPTKAGSRASEVNYDLPPAPMPPPVDRSVFASFNPVLPPEPDTPFDDSEDGTTSPPPNPEDQQVVQPASPSALRALFEACNDKQSDLQVTSAHLEGPAPAANSGEVGEPALDVSPPQSAPDLGQSGPATTQDSRRLTVGVPLELALAVDKCILTQSAVQVSQGVQTDEGEKEESVNGLDEGRESGGLEDLSRGASSNEANQTSSIPASASPALISDLVIPQQTSAGAGDQAELPGEENLWNFTSLLRFILALQIQTRTSPQEAPEVPAGPQNDVAPVVASRPQTPELSRATAPTEYSESEARHSAGRIDGSSVAV
ncbi:hypothetical protein FRC00_006721, partial [Tulasnella sp. 408]